MKKATKSSAANRYWLMKTEPDVFSIEDLANCENQTTSWVGVRNYQARNYMRDQMQLGDLILLYHSNAKPSCVVGTAVVVKTSHPDPTALDKSSPYFDPKSTAESPRWFLVDVRLQSTFKRALSLDMLREVAALQNMVLLKKGMRLSVQPVTKQEFLAIEKLGGIV